MTPEQWEDVRQRIEREATRQPLFENYFPAALEFAIIATLEEVEEQDYEQGPHSWCHGRPAVLALLRAAVERATGFIGGNGGG